MARLRKWVPCVLTAFLVLLLAGGVAGCGGGDDGGSGGTSTTIAPAAVVPAVATAETPAELSERLIGSTVEATDLTPPEVATALKEKRPMVVLFYVTASYDDDIVRGNLEKLQPKYADVLFLTYDYAKPKAYGDLAQQLKVNYPPQVLFIDANGVVRSLTSGYADEGTLNQHVVNIQS